jgi:hypothetical protein
VLWSPPFPKTLSQMCVRLDLLGPSKLLQKGLREAAWDICLRCVFPVPPNCCF